MVVVLKLLLAEVRVGVLGFLKRMHNSTLHTNGQVDISKDQYLVNMFTTEKQIEFVHE